MSDIKVNWTDLTWRKTQNRLVGKGGMRYYDYIDIVGQNQTIRFRKVGPGIDPHKKKNPDCVIFKPEPFYPPEIQLITLYVH